jgi:hypothetical protein
LKAKRRLAAPIVVTLAGLPGCVNGERSAAPPTPVATAAPANASTAAPIDLPPYEDASDDVTAVPDIDPDPPAPLFDAGPNDAQPPIGPTGEIRRVRDGLCKQWVVLDCRNGQYDDPVDPCNPPGPYTRSVMEQFECDAGSGSDSSR